MNPIYPLPGHAVPICGLAVYCPSLAPWRAPRLVLHCQHFPGIIRIIINRGIISPPCHSLPPPHMHSGAQS